jgi:hypothetical protein
MRLLVVQFSPVYYYFLSHALNILLSTLHSNTHKPYSSLRARDQFSHPRKTIGKIIVFHVLNFMFSDRR